MRIAARLLHSSQGTDSREMAEPLSLQALLRHRAAEKAQELQRLDVQVAKRARLSRGMELAQAFRCRQVDLLHSFLSTSTQG